MDKGAMPHRAVRFWFICLTLVGLVEIFLLEISLHTQRFFQSPAARGFGASRALYQFQQFEGALERLDRSIISNTTLKENFDATYFAVSNQPDHMKHNGWLVRPLPGRLVPFNEVSCRSSVVHVAVIGAMKAGTTDFVKKLRRCLPESVLSPGRKESHCLDGLAELAKAERKPHKRKKKMVRGSMTGGTICSASQWAKSVAHNCKFKPYSGSLEVASCPANCTSMTMDATPKDLCNDQAPAYFERFAPFARKVVLLRNPVARVMSHIAMSVNHSDPSAHSTLVREIDDLIHAALASFASSLTNPALPTTDEEHSSVYIRAWRDCAASNRTRGDEMELVCNAVARSLYAYQVAHWWRSGALHRNNTLIAASECARAHQPAFWAEVVDFLADGHPLLLRDAAQRKACLAAQPGFANVRERRLAVRSGTLRTMEAFFAPHNARLFAFLARHFGPFEASPCLDWKA